jgi:hypothetical protein
MITIYNLHIIAGLRCVDFSKEEMKWRVDASTYKEIFL